MRTAEDEELTSRIRESAEKEPPLPKRKIKRKRDNQLYGKDSSKNRLVNLKLICKDPYC